MVCHSRFHTSSGKGQMTQTAVPNSHLVNSYMSLSTGLLKPVPQGPGATKTGVDSEGKGGSLRRATVLMVSPNSGLRRKMPWLPWRSAAIISLFSLLPTPMPQTQSGMHQPGGLRPDGLAPQDTATNRVMEKCRFHNTCCLDRLEATPVAPSEVQV